MKILVTMYDIAGHVNGVVSVYIPFVNSLADAGYDVVVGCPFQNAKKPAGLCDDVRFVTTATPWKWYNTEEWGTELVDKEHPDMIIAVMPWLYPLLDEKYDSIPRILMLSSHPSRQFTERIIGPRFPERYVNTVAQSLQKGFIKDMPEYVRRWPVTVIGNPIEQYAKQVNYDKLQKRIVFFSRVDKLKNVHTLLEAFHIVSYKHPDWVLDIYGQESEPRISAFLREYIDIFDLKERVHLNGVIENREDTLVEYDICAFPSRLEGFSIGLGECMSAGLPCIGLKTAPGVNEMITDGVNGILCEDSTVMLADAINHLIENPAERKRLGMAAKRYISNFTLENISRQYVNLIESIRANGITKLK